MTTLAIKSKVNGDSVFNKLSFASALLIFVTLIGILLSLIEGGWYQPLRNLVQASFLEIFGIPLTVNLALPQQFMARWLLLSSLLLLLHRLR